jgi:hypothetical protein
MAEAICGGGLMVEFYMVVVELQKWRFGPWESINPSRQFPEFISYNLP